MAFPSREEKYAPSLTATCASPSRRLAPGDTSVRPSFTHCAKCVHMSVGGCPETRPFSFFQVNRCFVFVKSEVCDVSDSIAFCCRNISPQARHLIDVLHLDARHAARHAHDLPVFASGCDVDKFYGVFVGFEQAATLVSHDFYGQRAGPPQSQVHGV